jgi:hypothetical protein
VVERCGRGVKGDVGCREFMTISEELGWYRGAKGRYWFRSGSYLGFNGWSLEYFVHQFKSRNVGAVTTTTGISEA